MSTWPRLSQLYQMCVIVSALVGAFSTAMLLSTDFSPSLIKASEGLFTSSIISATVSSTSASTLAFHFFSQEGLSHFEKIVAFTPVFILDAAILEVLVGLTMWYIQRVSSWQQAMMIGQVFILVTCLASLASWMAVQWNSLGSVGATSQGQHCAAESS